MPKHVIDPNFLGCPSRINFPIYCRKCDEYKEACFEEDLPDGCFAVWAQEATNNFAAAEHAPDGASARYTVYREVAKHAGIFGIRRPWPKCLSKAVQARFGKSRSGYAPAPNTHNCHTCKRIREDDLEPDERKSFEFIGSIKNQGV